MRKVLRRTPLALLALLAACGGLAGGPEEVPERGSREGGVGAVTRASGSAAGPAAGSATGPIGEGPTGRAAGSPPSPRTTSEEPATICETVRGGGDHVAQLVDVRVGTHDGYDRIVFEFAAPAERGAFGVPRFEVRPLEAPIRDDPEGSVVPVEGSSFAGVVFHGAGGALFTTSSPQGYELTYQGPRELRTGFPVLVEAEQTGDFEATLIWVFGLSRPTCAEVSILHEPLRVVIDFPSN